MIICSRKSQTCFRTQPHESDRTSAATAMLCDQHHLSAQRENRRSFCGLALIRLHILKLHSVFHAALMIIFCCKSFFVQKYKDTLCNWCFVLYSFDYSKLDSSSLHPAATSVYISKNRIFFEKII